MNTDNQQGTPTEAEIAWLAGIIEGEGTIMLGAWRRNEAASAKNLKVQTHIILYNTDAGIILKAVEVMRRLGLSPHIQDREQKPMLRPGGGEYKPSAVMTRVFVKNLREAQKLLRTLRPWFFGDKAARADLMLQYLDQRIAKIDAAGGNGRIPYGQDDLVIIDRFYALTRPGKAKALEGLLNELEQDAA